MRILDLGGSPLYWLAFDEAYLQSRNVHITIVNTAEQNDFVDDPRLVMLIGDACNLGHFADNSFDLVHSNSVIEHVGDWERMEKFANEMRRLAPYYYLQTPYFWFPVEPHFIAPFFHWLPESWRVKLLSSIGVGGCHAGSVGEAMWWVRESLLLDRAQVRYLFPDATIRFEWLLFLPKSVIATRIAKPDS